MVATSMYLRGEAAR